MNFKKIFIPSTNNLFIWLSAVSLLVLLIAGFADAFAIVMAYFLETFLIGLVHCFKMYFVGKRSMMQQANPGKKVNFLILFFMFHYSFFVAVQSIFVFAIFQLADSNLKDPFMLAENYRYVLGFKGIGLGLLIMFIFIALQTYFSFFRTGMYHYYTVDKMFFQPYLRIFVQQFTVILAMFFVAFIHSGIIAAIILIILRLLVDLVGVFLNSGEKNKRALANKLAQSSDQSPEEIYDEINHMC